MTIVESNGARYKAEAAFENNGVYRIAEELGVRVVNLSNDELVEVADPRMKGFGLARTWLEADAFITLLESGYLVTPRSRQREMTETLARIQRELVRLRRS